MKYSVLYNLLRDPVAPTEGNGSSAVTAPKPVTTPGQLKPSPSSGVPHPAKAVPEDLSKMTFSSDDFTDVSEFEVQQLPTQVEKPKEKAEKTPSVVVQKKGEEVTLSDEETGEEKETPTAPKEEKKETGLPKFMKAPGEKKEESAPVQQQNGKKENIKPVTVGAGKVVRDYAGHSAEEVAVLKQMSDPAYAFAKKTILENRELAKLRETSYLQHEQAYVLDPAFQELQTNIIYANKEAKYWEEQLLLMGAGKAWKPITKWDANGNPVTGEERQPNQADEEQVRRMMNNCYQTAQQLGGQAQTYPTKYKQQVQTDLQAINQERANRFSWVADPKLEDYTIPIDGLGELSIKEIKKQITELFPPYMRSHPTMPVIGDLMVALRIAHAELAEARNSQTVTQLKEEEVSRGEPSSQVRQPAPAKTLHGVTEFKGLPEDF